MPAKIIKTCDICGNSYPKHSQAWGPAHRKSKTCVFCKPVKDGREFTRKEKIGGV